MDLKKLSSEELREFVQVRGQIPSTDLVSQATQLLNTNGPGTYPVADLMIATQIAPNLALGAKYSLHDLYTLPENTVFQFATIFGLDPNQIGLRERIIRILRFLNLIIPDNSCYVVPSKTNYISISELICGRLNTNVNWKGILEGSPNQCSPLGFKIATSLIRIAATRIFAEPEQSILELPVNSIDSYVEQMKRLGRTDYARLGTVGKFGLGFFSFLYWLVGHPLRYLHLESTFREYSGELCSWEMIIVEYSGNLIFQFGKLPTRKLTGTNISLHAENDPFRQEEIREFTEQLRKLKYVIALNIYVNGQLLNPTEKICGRICPKIDINMTSMLIQNVDFAMGISLETLFGSLLVPSISTKQIQDVVFTPSANDGTVINSNADENRFVLLVGNIAVISLFFTHNYYERYEIIIQMKAATPLPVSRDDILWDRPGVSEEFSANLTKLRQTIFSTNPQLLYILRQSLNAYINYQSSARNLVENFWIETRRFLENNNIYFVPLEFVNIFHRLNNQHFIGMDESVGDALERYLTTNFQWQTNIFFGKYIMTLPNFTERVSTAGTSRFLFIDESFTRNSREWVAEVAASLPNEYLLPVEMQIGQQDNQEIQNLLQGVNSEIYSGAYGLILQFTGLTTYFSINDLPTNLRNFISGIRYAITIDNQLTKDLIVLTRNYIRKNIPENYAYGVSRPQFFVLRTESTVSTPYFPSEIKKNKAISYIRNFYRDLYGLLFREKYYIVPAFVPSPIQATFYSRQGMLSTTQIFESSENFYEYLALTLLDELNTLTPDEVTTLLEYWRTRLDTPINRDLLLLYVNTSYREDEYRSKVKNPLETILQIMRRNQNIYRTLPPATFTTGPSQYTFTLSSLIDYVFNDPTLTFENFLEKVPQIATWKIHQSSSFQALEIAINEGTTKPFVQAVMTETFQNAIDAMRLEGIEGIVTVQVATVEPSSLALVISDPVGISSPGLLALSIPFLSTKTPSEIVTGEMGSGFFNIYRESDLVRIRTVKNGTLVFIEDVPIKRAGRVIDVARKMDISSIQEPNGTRISMVFNPRNVYQAFTEIYYIGQNVLPLSGRVNLNGTIYTIPRESLFTSPTFEAYSMSDLEVSWILTKGVPFREFVEYFTSTDVLPLYLSIELTTGFLLNIKHGGYTPVQSRTKIIIPENLKRELREFLYNAIYLRMLQKYLAAPVNQQDHYIPNTSSQESISQLQFNITPNYNNLSQFILNYIFGTSQPLTQILNDMSRFIGERIPSTIEQEVRRELERKLTNPIIVNAAWKWLSNKNLVKPPKSTANNTIVHIGSTTSTIITTTVEPKVTVNIDKTQNLSLLTRFTQLFVTTFWQIGASLRIVGTNFSGNPPTVQWKSMPPGILGQFVAVRNSIEFDLDRADVLIGRILQITVTRITAEKLLSLLRSSDVRDWFGVIYPASTFVHELSHAWRRTSHSAFHQPITLTINGQIRTYNFEEAANVVYQEILRRGFIDRFINAWN